MSLPASRGFQLWWLRGFATVVLSPIFAAASALVALENAAFIDPYWLDVSAKSTIPLLFLAPGLAATAAWDTARLASLAEASARTWVELQVRLLLIVATISALIYGAMLLVLASQAPPVTGTPSFALIGMAVLACCGYASIGMLLGRVLPRLIATPLAFVGVWLWVAFTPTLEPFWLRNVTGAIGTSCCSLDRELIPGALLAPSLLATGLIVGSAVAMSWPTRPHSWIASLSILSATLAFAAHLVHDAGADPVTLRTGQQVCLSVEGNDLCAWPEHADQLSANAAALAATANRLRTSGLAIPHVVREGDAGTWSYTLSDAPEAVVSSFVQSPLRNFPPDCTNEGADWPGGQDFEVAGAWLDTRNDVTPRRAARTNYASLADLQKLLAQSAEQQNSWFNVALASMQHCGPR